MIKALLLTPFLCGYTVVSAPSTSTPVTWSPASVTITYPQGHPTDITDGSDVTAIQSALASWSHIGCSTFRYTDGGRVASASTNTIQYITNAGDFANAGALAYTLRTQDSGHWTSAVVKVNDFGFHWATTGALYLDDSGTKAYDFQSTITHELGHVLGLGHSPDPEATMYYGGRQGRTYFRTLSDDDVKGACFLYPVSAAACSSNADCPLQDTTEGGAAEVTICSGGSCVSGKRGYGEDCFASSDCTTGTCTKFDGTTQSYDPGQCTHGCPCPGSDVCNGTVCAPRAADCAPGCADGEHVCTPTVDGDFACVPECVSSDTHLCTGESICFDPVSSASAGLCRTPGPKKTGLSCDAPSDCASLVCNSGIDGEQTCVGPELAPPTITTDPPPPPDSGPMDDGAGGGDSDGTDSGDFADRADAPLNDDGSGYEARGGCAEAAPSFMMVAFALLVALRLRRI